MLQIEVGSAACQGNKLASPCNISLVPSDLIMFFFFYFGGTPGGLRGYYSQALFSGITAVLRTIGGAWNSSWHQLHKSLAFNLLYYLSGILEDFLTKG